MSKFIDMLEKVGQQLPSPMGFSPASRHSEAAPQILLVGRLRAEELSKSPGLAEAGVDALLIALESWDKRALDRITKPLGDRLWGVGVSGINEEQARELKAAGCDYIVFDAEDTAAAVLNDEEMGKVIAVSPNLSEDVARAIYELPIDAALFSPEQGLLPLTVRKLIDIQLVRGLVDRPFVMAAPPDLGRPELEAFRNAGITGLMLELKSADHISEIREAISNLPRRKPRATPRGAIVPLVPAGFPQPDQGGEEEGDEDDDDGEF